MPSPHHHLHLQLQLHRAHGTALSSWKKKSRRRFFFFSSSTFYSTIVPCCKRFSTRGISFDYFFFFGLISDSHFGPLHSPDERARARAR